MTLSELNAFCASLAHTHSVIQWGGAQVWKVDTKVFAIAWDDPEFLQITFKASEFGYEVMRDMPGLRPAPYLASRGMKWIQHFEAPGLTDAELKTHIQVSYEMVSKNLTKKRQKELGLNQS